VAKSLRAEQRGAVVVFYRACVCQTPRLHAGTGAPVWMIQKERREKRTGAHGHGLLLADGAGTGNSVRVHIYTGSYG